ncbi:hypothetical protein ZWY2020_012959 [Hordeum vulgare]|nr:hypothetical protein ZWY2020_012959 [Hordeum vulgare]
MATASTSASASSSSRTLEPDHTAGMGSSAEASWPFSRDGGGEENVLDLDSPWAAVAEAGSRLEQVASTAGVGCRSVEEAGQLMCRGLRCKLRTSIPSCMPAWRPARCHLCLMDV